MIMVFADLTCPLQSRRIKILKELPYEKILVHNATGNKLPDNFKKFYEGFIIKEQPAVKNKNLRYFLSMIYSFYLLIKFRPKLVVVHWASRVYQTLGLYPFLGKTITTVMGSEIMPGLETAKPIKKVFINLFIRNSSVITVKSEYMKKILIENFLKNSFNKPTIKIINFGVHKRFFNIMPDKTLMEKYNLKNKKVFFSIRSLKKFYRIKEIVESFIEYKKVFQSNSILLITRMGEEYDYYQSIKKMVNNSGFADDIIFLKEIDYEDMHKYISISNVIVSFVNSDGLPHSMLEALYAKKFMIFRKLPQYEGFLFHKINAYLVTSKMELTEAFKYCSNNNLTYDIDFNKILSFSIQKEKYLSLCRMILEQ